MIFVAKMRFKRKHYNVAISYATKKCSSYLYLVKAQKILEISYKNPNCLYLL